MNYLVRSDGYEHKCQTLLVAMAEAARRVEAGAETVTIIDYDRGIVWTTRRTKR